MNIKIIILILIGIAFSGCIDDRNLQLNTKYDIIDINLENAATNRIVVMYLDNNSIKSISIYTMDKYLGNMTIECYSCGKLVIDNSTYMITTRIDQRAKSYDMFTYADQTYSEIHVTKEDLKLYTGYERKGR